MQSYLVTSSKLQQPVYCYHVFIRASIPHSCLDISHYDSINSDMHGNQGIHNNDIARSRVD